VILLYPFKILGCILYCYLSLSNSKVCSENYIFVSDDLGHNIGSVYAILQKLMPDIKNHVRNLEVVHYWTDSPSSQYRNKTAFYIVSDHRFNINVFSTSVILLYPFKILGCILYCYLSLSNSKVCGALERSTYAIARPFPVP
jgi:hypothetical protein